MVMNEITFILLTKRESRNLSWLVFVICCSLDDTSAERTSLDGISDRFRELNSGYFGEYKFQGSGSYCCFLFGILQE